MGDPIFKAEAEGDTVYLSAQTEDEAYANLTAKLGPIPRSMVTFTQVDEIPEDEELL